VKAAQSNFANKEMTRDAKLDVFEDALIEMHEVIEAEAASDSPLTVDDLWAYVQSKLFRKTPGGAKAIRDTALSTIARRQRKKEELAQAATAPAATAPKASPDAAASKATNGTTSATDATIASQ